MKQRKILDLDDEHWLLFKDGKLTLEQDHGAQLSIELDPIVLRNWLTEEVLQDQLILTPRESVQVAEAIVSAAPGAVVATSSLEDRRAVSVLPSGPIPAGKKDDLQVHNLTHEIGKAAVAFSKENLNRDQVITRDGTETPNS